MRGKPEPRNFELSVIMSPRPAGERQGQLDHHLQLVPQLFKSLPPSADPFCRPTFSFQSPHILLSSARTSTHSPTVS
ncbi:hypothetical protein HETIRDRAFT_420528 [Heterobasidion irregulare TC 32-1]|uniref:Uncharacterized protein n=1 Tax=Heterobasidion irregulare (strain TC 32-1) TaxID=747525 RepID=W4JVV7_HETIT|nr:uncharacterized protein HETIRDRAFT_420528 [Heterobasidion irregulare TC 32-1]ETW77682.1 hypothetical protein HETIRDRAFT_420528 [Heterobasidion irregulare TC 32-1]